MANITEFGYAVVYGHNGIYVYKEAHKKKVLKKSEADLTIGKLISKFVSCELGDTKLHELRVGKFAPAAMELKRNRLEEAATSAQVNALVITANTV
jgi:hypothetical protein